MTPIDVEAISQWLRQQLDDDERVARDATQGKWRWTDPGGCHKLALVAGTWPTETMIVPSGLPDVYPSRYDAEHIARWDPARVLAEIDAKRRIINELSGRHPEPAVLRLLALPYADRPGFREEWRP